MANPDQFVNRIRRLAEGVITGAARSARNTVISVTQTVTRRTPVDTTLARSNWIANIGRPDVSPRPFRSRTEVTDEVRANVTLAKIEESIKSSDSVEIHIANGGEVVPYLKFLNDGSSQQAPAGFVEDSLRDGSVKPLEKSKLLIGTRGSGAKGV